MRRLPALLLLLPVSIAAQESGWHYSPYPGEGDRAALGCAYGSTPDDHVCVAVRCEDDFTVAVHIDTTRAGGDAGRWTISIDDEDHAATAAAQPGSPYGARIEGDTADLLDAIKHGVSLFVEPMDGSPVVSNGIGLAGSLQAINQALYFCAPRVVPGPE